MNETAVMLLSMRDVMDRTSLSRGAVHQLIRSGRLRALKHGRRVLVRSDDLSAFVDTLERVEP